jgi:hypothetical protein
MSAVLLPAMIAANPSCNARRRQDGMVCRAAVGRRSWVCLACRRHRSHDLGSGTESVLRARSTHPEGARAACDHVWAVQIRPPGYAAAIAMFVGIPLALASWWGLLPAGLAIALLVHLVGGLNPFGMCRAQSVRLLRPSGNESAYPARCTSRPDGFGGSPSPGRTNRLFRLRALYASQTCAG